MTISESKIIANIAHQFPHATPDYLGIGDDAALVFHHHDTPLLITNDSLVEDVHFRLSYFTPEALAHKVLNVNLSDIAAMGGIPRYLLLSLSIPPSTHSDWLEKFLHYFCQLCKTFNINIIGGDTTASPDKIYISVTLIGTAGRSIKLRSHAKENDILCVTGTLGDAYSGLLSLEKNLQGFDTLKNKYLFPQAKIAEGEFFSTLPAVNAMMDISDGLYLDLAKFCEASKIGADILTESIPISKTLQEEAGPLKIAPLTAAIQGGEDYELLIAIKPDDLLDVQREFLKRFGYGLHPIGKATASKEINYLANHKKIKLDIKPYTHFGEKA